jgi:hypothetical protein
MLAKSVHLLTTPLVPQIATGAKALADVIDTSPRRGWLAAVAVALP